MSFLDVLQLQGRRLDVSLVRPCTLVRGGHRPDAGGTAVVAHSVDRDVVTDDGLVVHVVHAGHVGVGDRPVVRERAADPAAAHVTRADVSKAVIDATVEADVGTPVSGV